MKKLFGVFVLGLLMFSMLGTLVSAAGMIETVQGGVRDGYTAIEPALKFAMGDTGESPELFLAKILLAIIIFSIVWIAMSKISFFAENTWSLWLITIAVSLLAIRWIGGANVVNTIILPYSALGVAITAGLPFVLAFLIIENNFNKTMRKVAWVFFIVIFVALWIMRSGDNAVGAGSIGGPIGSFVWIYLATAILALGVLFFDGTIQKILGKIEVEKGDVERKRKQIRHWREELENIDKDYKRDSLNYKSVYVHSKPKGQQSYKADIEYVNKQIVALKI
jgi:hypothetical protein